MMNEVQKFDFNMNRSERALQVACLVPALSDKRLRWDLLSSIKVQEGNPITADESDQAKVMHFVFVLRDSFTGERDCTNMPKKWNVLRKRWCEILDLPEWGEEAVWWRHPNGEYKGDTDYMVHPCSRQIGWRDDAVKRRAKTFNVPIPSKDDIHTLVTARKVMNTECDCFIQTPKRLIVVECKDKTSFKKEQGARQKMLYQCLERLYVRPEPLIYVALSDKYPRTCPNHWWSWDMLPKPE